MAKYNQGVLGSFSSKVAPIPDRYQKKLPPIHGGGKTKKKQVVSKKAAFQRANFSFPINFLNSVGDLPQIGVPRVKSQWSAGKIVIVVLQQNTIKGVFPGLLPGCTIALIASDLFFGMANGLAAGTKPGMASFTRADNTGYGKSKNRLILIMFCEKHEYIPFYNSYRTTQGWHRGARRRARCLNGCEGKLRR